MRSLRRFAVAASFAAAVAAGCEKPEPKPAEQRKEIVFVDTPVEREVTDYEDFTGRTDAIFTVEVRARVTGYLDSARFKDGDEVEKGALLFEIDPRPYKADLDRSEATLAQGEAHLRRLEADFKRVQSLYARGNVSREEFDKVSGDRNEALAAVGIYQAQYDLAKLNLSYCRIEAPIAGRLSRRLVDPGNLVQQDQTLLTTIVTQDPLYVYFDVDDRTLLRIRRLVREGKVPSRSQEDITVYVALADEDDYPRKGLINFSENRVDPNTGTLRARATIENPRPYLLSPGLFVRVRLPVGHPHKSLLVAEKAMGTEQGEKYVYVVGKDNTVAKRRLQVGRLDGRMRVVESGLGRDERVVVEGLQRVRPGATVTPKPASESPATAGTGAEKPGPGAAPAGGASPAAPAGAEKARTGAGFERPPAESVAGREAPHR
jgi:RND family efflux transporter MFP subunit